MKTTRPLKASEEMKKSHDVIVDDLNKVRCDDKYTEKKLEMRS